MRGNFRPQTKHWTHWTDFNSRLYMRGNLVNCSMPPNVYYFNSRLYMRGNFRPQTKHWTHWTDFNSRLYMRGNFCLPRSPAPQCISIHASTWEATLFWCIKLSVFKISIHASTWEATPPQSALIVGSSTFQFTPLHERQREEVIPMETEGIFQFTPLHERQQFLPLVRQIAFPYFNSRLYMRGSILRIWLSYKKRYFNSRLYMRGSTIHVSCLNTNEFQFTPLHERQRCPKASKHSGKHISIHASTWEAAKWTRQGVYWLFYFNSRLYMRGSDQCGQRLYWKENFNSRLYMRGSVHTNVPISGTSYFNSRLYMRGSKGVHLFGEYMNISIHASTWEAASRTLGTVQAISISIHASTWEAASHLSV